MFVKQIYTGCLAQAAYYVESNGEAAIVDPLRETQPYIDLANERGAKIKYIFETHFHADFVSGHIDLAKKTGATIVYGPNASAQYDIYVAKDDEVFNIGDITVVALHTPGHTMESTTYLLRDESGKDNAIFTGDTLFIGDVGRPDLAVKTNLTREDLAGHLYHSLHNKIMPLADDVLIYPGHGAGSACGKKMSNETIASLGDQKRLNYALQPMSKEEFVHQVTEGLSAPPQYFPKNAAMNKQGYSSFDEVLEKGTTPVSIDDMLTLQEEGAIVLDTRTPDAFVKGHVPGSMFVGIDGSFASWVGTLIPDITRPIVVIAEAGKEEEVVTRLARVGYDNTLGYLKGGFDAWLQSGKPVGKIESVTPDELSQALADKALNILDVRKESEYDGAHVEGAENFPLDYINENYYKLDKNKTYHLHCKGGYRSVIAASILKSIGVDKLVNIEQGWDGIVKTDVPTVAMAG